MVEGVGIKRRFRTTLMQHGLEIPSDPSREELSGPRDYLVRGTSNETTLFSGLLAPQAGEMGTFGVFFSDNTKFLMYPDPGIYFVFQTEALNREWLVYPSVRYEETATQIARDTPNPEFDPLSRGIALDRKVYERNSVYHTRTGKATVNVPLSVDQAHTILVTRGYLPQQTIQGSGRMYAGVTDKIIEF